jgi:hypothetical protein
MATTPAEQDPPILPDIPDPDSVRRRLAVVLTEAGILRAQLRVSTRLQRERERLTVAMPPLSPSSVLVTSQFTLGTFLGTRPYTSRSNASTISARRFGHWSAVITFVPSLKVIRSGMLSFQGFAVASSEVSFTRASRPFRIFWMPS